MLVLIAAFQMLAPTASPAAIAAADDSVKHSRLCWRARPAPRCSWFLVTEFGLTSNSGLTADYGVMANRGLGSAVGASVIFGEDESVRRTGITARYRRWMNPRLALEAGAGPVMYCELSDADSCGERRGVGVQIQTAVHLWGLAAGSVSFEHLGATNRGYVGVKFGAYAAPLALLASGILQGATWD